MSICYTCQLVHKINFLLRCTVHTATLPKTCVLRGPYQVVHLVEPVPLSPYQSYLSFAASLP